MSSNLDFWISEEVFVSFCEFASSAMSECFTLLSSLLSIASVKLLSLLDAGGGSRLCIGALCFSCREGKCWCG